MSPKVVVGDRVELNRFGHLDLGVVEEIRPPYYLVRLNRPTKPVYNAVLPQLRKLSILELLAEAACDGV